MDYRELPQDAGGLLEWAIRTYRDRFAVCTSFQNEGMVLIDMAVKADPKVRVFTIDTGRLPEETHEAIESVRKHYGIAVEIVAPDHREVESMTSRYGVNLFRDEVAYRKLCCHIRKVRPLERKLGEFQAWAVGLRRDQSEERREVERVVEIEGKLKISPLVDWSAADIEEYLTRHNVPRHPLHAQGYPSIGCAPCTRAVVPGEGERDGRWWWERDASKECGIHVTASGQMKRTLDVLLEEILVH